MNEKQKLRFKNKTKQQDNGCVVWTGAKDAQGYGMAWNGLDIRRAHRVAWEAENGKIPYGICVCHKCDNPSCVNVSHLFLGTHAENMKDRDKKGRLKHATGQNHWSVRHPERIARGERHGTKTKPESVARGIRNGAVKHPERMARGERQWLSKLTDQSVREIRASSESLSVIAKRYGISVCSASKARRGDTWAHVK